MSALPARRAVMTLYADPQDPLGHAVRLVLAEKGVLSDIRFVSEDNMPEDLHHLNPYGRILTLVDRDLVLYDALTMMEYLDERYPHPPLMPVDPTGRANNRQLRYRVMQDLYSALPHLRGGNEIAAAGARKAIRDNLTAIAPAFQRLPYFMSQDFTLVDCLMAPLLLRLKHYGVALPPQGKPIQGYTQRLFERPAFLGGLSRHELALREAR